MRPVCNSGVILVLLAFATVANAAPPTSVTIAGDLQSELGCASDWDSACAATYLAYDSNSDVWKGTFALLPAGSYNLKAALDDSWTENYGLHAQFNGSNIPLALAAPGPVRFYYDHKSHWVTSDKVDVIANVPGDFQSELGCPRRLAARLLPDLAAGPDRERNLLVHHDRDPARVLPGEGGAPRVVVRELRRRRRARRRKLLLHRPARGIHDALLL
jgi:hypothetical protein